MKREFLLRMAVFLAIASAADASQFVVFSRESQIRSSDAVVVGRVVGTDSYWTPDRSVILTDAEVAIEEAWKGTLPERIVVQTLGGTVGNILLHVDGAATFEPGERVVLFLERHSSRWVPAGMRFGKLDVLGSGGDEFAVGLLPTDLAASGPVSISLGDLRTEVLGVVEGGR